MEHAKWLEELAHALASEGAHKDARRLREVAEYIRMLEWTRHKLARSEANRIDHMARRFHQRYNMEDVVRQIEDQYKKEVQDDTNCGTVSRQSETAESE